MRRRHGLQTLRREDGRIVCEKVIVADTWLRRARGLLLRRSVPSDEGCVLRPSFSIHTAFLQFPIDVVFLDHDLVVQKIMPSVRPFAVASSLGAREVVELRAGECERRGLNVGDRVAWASYQPAAAAMPSATAPGTDGSGLHVIVASDDKPFVSLLRFHLDEHGIRDVRAVAQAGVPRAAEAAAGAPCAVVLDVEDDLADALATTNALHGWSPDVHVYLAGADAADTSPPPGVEVFPKLAAAAALAERIAGDAADDGTIVAIR